MNLFAYEYSGYGVSTGEPTEANTYADIQAAFDYVSFRCKTPSQEIVLYGQSVGSGPSIYLAARNQIAGCIIHSGFTSGMRVLTSNRTLGCLDIYPNIERISNIQCHTLVIHGKKDQEVDISHGMSLYEAIPQQFRVLPYFPATEGHNNIGEARQSRIEYYSHLNNFFEILDQDR